MDKVPTIAVDNFLTMWSGTFPDMPLTAADLKRPQTVMVALFKIFDRLGVSMDAVLMSPEESDEHTTYYRDLLPVINTTRIINHVVSIMPVANLCFLIMHLLQPTIVKSYTILMVLLNQMVFNEARLGDIAAREEELFAHKEEVKALTEKKDNLIQMRNMEAAEKGNRAERLEQLEHDIPLLEEEVKQEKEIEAEVIKELEAITEDNKQTDILLEQKKAHRDGILVENARKKALKVYDAEDIRGQVERAAQNFREAEEKLSTLSATLTQKESSLHNLQSLKPTLDQTNTLLHDIMKMADSIKELENGDLDTDSAEGELVVLGTELGELQAALADARAEAERAAARRARGAAARARARGERDSALKESEEKHQRACAEASRAARLTQSIKEATAKYEHEKAAGAAELARIREQAAGSLTTMQNNLLNKMKDVYKRVEEQNQRQQKF
ncbi:M protein, serotype 12-like [Cydia pomonella]|uniref:M protein, serotype 12-like n=1 Tax=Cydia pomonella TaxID=82600 RepID=UPI002ADE004F|nr:M protein, serotype 12-like [Cydia pomonella]